MENFCYVDAHTGALGVHMKRKNFFIILFFFLFSSVVFGNDVSIFVRAGKNAYKYDENTTRKIPIKEGTVYEIEGFGMDKYKDVSYEDFGDERDWYYSYFSKKMPILYTNNLDSICIVIKRVYISRKSFFPTFIMGVFRILFIIQIYISIILYVISNCFKNFSVSYDTFFTLNNTYMQMR